jgi:predicted Zn-dependent protease
MTREGTAMTEATDAQVDTTAIRERWEQATTPDWRVGFDEFVTIDEALAALRSMLAQSPRLRVWYVDRDDSTSHGGVVCITGNGPTSEANAVAIAHARQDIDAALARAEAAERVVDEVRSEYPDSVWDAWRTNFAAQPDEVTESTHVRRVIKAVLAYDATTRPATAGDAATHDGGHDD